MAKLVEAATEQTRHAERVGARLPTQAIRFLAGVPLISGEQQLAALREVRAADVAAAAREAYGSGLLRTPGLNAAWTGFTEAPWRSEKAITGRAFRSKNGHSRLIVGVEGVTSKHGESICTVRYDDCAVMIRRADGGRILIGHDAITVVAEPAWYGEEAVREIDARVPEALCSDQPAVAPERIGTPGRPRRDRASLRDVVRRDARIYMFIGRRLVVSLVLVGGGGILAIAGVNGVISHVYAFPVILLGGGVYLMQREARRIWGLVRPLVAR